MPSTTVQQQVCGECPVQQINIRCVVSAQHNSPTAGEWCGVRQQEIFPRKCYFSKILAISIVHPVLMLGDLELSKFKLNVWQQTFLCKAFIVVYFFEYKRKEKTKFFAYILFCFNFVAPSNM